MRNHVAKSGASVTTRSAQIGERGAADNQRKQAERRIRHRPLGDHTILQYLRGPASVDNGKGL